MIDLHLHTTASDGEHPPEELVRRAWMAGVTTLSVTDHDTTASTAATAAAAARYGIETLTGIEITSVWHGTDVHLLGYFLDPAAPALQAFLQAQRAHRIRRTRAIVARLAEMGLPIDEAPLLADARASPGRSIGRPQVALALVGAGHVASVREAFDRWLGEGRPAYVPRVGPTPEQTVSLIADAGGVASLAHPGLLRHDELIPQLAAAGLAAIEAYHAEHDRDAEARYRALASEYGLAVTGGSDYHGESTGRPVMLGVVGLPAQDFERLRAHAGH